MAAPLLQQQDTITIAGRQVQVMQDHQHRRAAIGKLPDGLQGDVLMQRIEGRRGLIQQQVVSTLSWPQLRQDPRQMHPLPLSTRQRQVAAPRQMHHIGRLQRSTDYLCVTHATTLMGQAPKPHHFLDPKSEVQTRRLRQHRQTLRPQCTLPLRQLLPIQRHSALVGRQLSTHGSEQAAFTGAIGSKHPQYLARQQLQVHAGQNIFTTTADMQILDSQHQARPRNNRYKKNGAPIKAVTIPMGNSAGASARRATRSANSNKLAPARIDAGSKVR